MKLLFHTLKYLKPVQVYGRLWFRLYRPRVKRDMALVRRSMTGPWVGPCEKISSFSEVSDFRFLNQTQKCKFPEDWNNPEWEKLWLYNLHYFDDLQAAGTDGKKEIHADLIDAWIRGNPPGHGNGWEPYPTSLRIVNWIKWILAGNNPSADMLKSLAIQARFLRRRLEIHLLGNHLFANAKALVFAGLFFEGREADGWLKKGLEILAREIPEQILSDGGHFERSPMYHAIILEDLLDLINAMRTYGVPIPQGWEKKTGDMIFWLSGMQHPDGEISLFNDAAFAIAPLPEDLECYAGRLGVGIENRALPSIQYFADTGYVRWEKGPALAFLDVGPVGPDYLPGHAHADTLSFEMSLFGHRFIVDSGISCYGSGAERLRQRGTAAHNTVMIDNENSSEVWGGFRVARRAYPVGLTAHTAKGAFSYPADSKETHPAMPRDTVAVACSHNGYQRLPGSPVHRRQWTLTENFLEIMDEIQGSYQEARARFHFHPDIKITVSPRKSGQHNEINQFNLHFPHGSQAIFRFEGGRGNITESTWHPEFGISRPGQCIDIQFRRDRLTSTITWKQ